MDIAGNKRTDGGTQTVVVSLRDKTNYEWTDGTQDDAEFMFTVGHKALPEPEYIIGTTYNGGYQPPVLTVTDGFTVLNMGTDYDVVWNDTEFVNAGIYVATVSGMGDYSGTRTAFYEIDRIRLGKPAEDSTVFVYDGTEKIYSPVGFDGTTMGMEGNSRLTAGSQTVTVSILDDTNYEWTDGTQDDLTFRFDVGASADSAAEKYDGLYKAVATAVASTMLVFCVRYLFGRP